MLPSSYRRCGGDKRHPQFQLHRIGQLHRVPEFFIGTTANVFHRSHCQRGFLHASTPVLNSFHCHRVHDPRQRPSRLGMCTNSDSHHCVLTFITPAPLSYRQHRVQHRVLVPSQACMFACVPGVFCPPAFVSSWWLATEIVPAVAPPRVL